MRNKRILFLGLAGLFSLIAVLAIAMPVWAANRVPIYFFWGDGCPHCAEEKPFLQKLVDNNNLLEVREYEVWKSPGNQQRLKDMAEALNFTPSGVPVTIVGEKVWIGYNAAIGAEIEAAVDACLANGCPDPGAGVLFNKGSARDWSSSGPADPGTAPEPGEGKTITLPLIGTIDLSHQSLFLSTLLIAFVDGVNPCSMWVLTMLIALTLHTGSRRKIFTIGFIFITVTALVYALFIAGVFTVLNMVNFVGWIRVVVALISLVFAIINIKDYFWFKEGVSLTIADKDKPGIINKMRRVMDASDNFWAMAGATVVLAAGVSLVEFSCTAGFPVLWGNMVASQNVPALTFVLLLLVYLIIYQLDELAIFGIAVVTLKSNRFEEKHGRIIKLVGGMLMLSLALVMIINPALMNNVGTSLLIFGLAFLLAALVYFVHRNVLPRMGIRIGSEIGDSSRKRKRRR